MSRFHFRLQTLLRVRQCTREQCQAELAEVRRQDAELQSQLDAIEHEQSLLEEQSRAAAGPGVVDVRRLLQAQQYAAALRVQAEGIQQQRQRLAMEIDRRYAALVEAERELQVMDKLRENQSQAHHDAESRQEAKHLDEAALRTIGLGATIPLTSFDGGAAAPAA